MFRLCFFFQHESEPIFTSSYEDVYLKAESSNKNRIRIPGGQVKPNIIVSSTKNWIQYKRMLKQKQNIFVSSELSVKTA